MTLHHACVQKHTLVPIVGSYWVCECPQVYRKVGKNFLDPSLKGLLEDVVIVAESIGGIRALAKSIESNEFNKKATKRAEARKR